MSHRRKLSVLLSALILISILNLSSIPAATVSHTASQIVGGGALGSGDYVFPSNPQSVSTTGVTWAFFDLTGVRSGTYVYTWIAIGVWQ